MELEEQEVRIPKQGIFLQKNRDVAQKKKLLIPKEKVAQIKKFINRKKGVAQNYEVAQLEVAQNEDAQKIVAQKEVAQKEVAQNDVAQKEVAQNKEIKNQQQSEVNLISSDSNGNYPIEIEKKQLTDWDKINLGVDRLEEKLKESLERRKKIQESILKRRYERERV
jgi:fused signal recognition particle receptor